MESHTAFHDRGFFQHDVDVASLYTLSRKDSGDNDESN